MVAGQKMALARQFSHHTVAVQRLREDTGQTGATVMDQLFKVKADPA